MSTAIVVDCRSRDLNVFSASVTETVARGLVLRRAADLGRLSDLSGEGNIPHTVILLGSYAAQSSAGFTAVLRPAQHYDRWVAGGAGLGWHSYDDQAGHVVRRGDGLRAITDREAKTLRCTVISGGCSLVKIGGQGNSNVATAEAAMAGLRLRAEMRGEVIVAEGQSDRMSGWAFKAVVSSNGLGNTFPPEHREEIFAGILATPVPSDRPAVRRVRRVAPPTPPATADGGDEFVEDRKD
jgi:hypothetical protein